MSFYLLCPLFNKDISAKVGADLSEFLWLQCLFGPGEGMRRTGEFPDFPK